MSDHCSISNNSNNNITKIESTSSSPSSTSSTSTTIPSFDRTNSDNIIDTSITRVNSINHLENSKEEEKNLSSKGEESFIVDEDLKFEGDYDDVVKQEEEEEEEEYTYPEGGLKAWLAVLACFIFGCSQLGVSYLSPFKYSQSNMYLQKKKKISVHLS